MVKFELSISSTTRGPGFWKMNANVINSDLFRKAFISMWKDWITHMDDYTNENIWWDLGKAKIKDLARWCAIKIKQDKMAYISRLEAIINKFDENTDKNYIANTRLKLKKSYEEIGQGAEIRSRVKWFEEGEKPTKYFHSLEKCRGKEKTWNRILDSSDNIITESSAIQQIQVDYFKKLYASQELDSNTQDKFCMSIDKTLSANSVQMLDNDLSLTELYKAVSQMKNNKSPGPDGLIVEFYKMYWDVLKCDGAYCDLLRCI